MTPVYVLSKIIVDLILKESLLLKPLLLPHPLSLSGVFYLLIDNTHSFSLKCKKKWQFLNKSAYFSVKPTCLSSKIPLLTIAPKWQIIIFLPIGYVLQGR